MNSILLKLVVTLLVVLYVADYSQGAAVRSEVSNVNDDTVDLGFSVIEVKKGMDRKKEDFWVLELIVD